MPNWCSCGLIITGTPEKIKVFKGEMGDKFTFGTFFPRPEVLGEIHDGLKVVDGVVCHHWRERTERIETIEEGGLIHIETRVSYIPVSPDELAKLAREYGALSWYDWSLANWGTKWDVGNNSKLLQESDEMLHLTFDTAWSPPVEFLEKLSRRFPTMVFDLGYAEGGIGFYGHCQFRSGYQIGGMHVEGFWKDREEDDDDDYEPEPTNECQHHLDSYCLHTGG